jgi:hypothetical protein
MVHTRGFWASVMISASDLFHRCSYSGRIVSAQTKNLFTNFHVFLAKLCRNFTKYNFREIHGFISNFQIFMNLAGRGMRDAKNCILIFDNSPILKVRCVPVGSYQCDGALKTRTCTETHPVDQNPDDFSVTTS